MCGSDICLGIIAILFPPFAVWVKRGLCSADSLINIALCILGFLPGLLHAWYIIAVTPDPTYEEVPQDPERDGSVTYYYVQQGGPQYAQPQQAPPPKRQQQGYGTVNAAPRQQGGGPVAQAGSSSNAAADVPPSYQQATEGDNKIQRP